MITLSVPELRGNEWKYLKECLDANWVSLLGPFVTRSEQMVAEYIGVKHGVLKGYPLHHQGGRSQQLPGGDWDSHPACRVHS